ncbi:MAG: glycosyltransferase [Alphaproteobacteria bacterium]
MTQRPFVSVIVPVFNNGPYLEPCLRALERQSYPRDRLEILCVDNGSTDGSLDRLRSHGRIHVLQESKRGSYAARNRGLRAARGEIIAFTDGDCIADPDWVSAGVAALQDEAVALVLGRRRVPGASPALTLIDLYEAEKDASVIGGESADLVYGYTNNMIVRRCALDRFGPFDDIARGADTAFVQRVVRALSMRAVAFEPSMAVTHAEMTGLGVYFKKCYLYGRNRVPLRQESYARPLTYRHRFAIVDRVLKKRRLEAGQTLALLSMLAVGAASWTLGRWSQRFRGPR